MTSKFGFLARLNFLQDFTSWLIGSINPAIIHNVEKYFAIKKVNYLTAIEHLEGDYIEFGVFTGSSFAHSIRCSRNLRNIYPEIVKSKFIGFDSFEGFGEVSSEEEHPFYLDDNFATSFNKVTKRVSKAAKGMQFSLIKGYFSESLASGPNAYNISKARIIFIDSDTYSSARDAFIFCQDIIQEGTYIILDDFFSYKASKSKGVAKAFYEFQSSIGFDFRKVLTYGMGGVVLVISSLGR